MMPDVLLPAITCQADFIPYFLNLLRDWTAAAWSSRNTSTSTPVKTPTPVQRGNRSTQHSFSSADATPRNVTDQQTVSFTPDSYPWMVIQHTPGCIGQQTTSFTPDSNQRLGNRHTSTLRSSSAKSRPRGLNDISPLVTSPQEVNNEHELHSVRLEFAGSQPLRQHNSVKHTERLTPSVKERQGRALFSDASPLGGSCSVRNSAGKHKQSVGNKIEKVEPQPVPSFNLDSNIDFPDMKSSQRYNFCFV